MRKITKEPEPKFWTDFKKKNPQKAYNDLDKSDEGRKLRSKIRDFMIKNQKGLCCYCCKSIDTDNSLNEHIKPKSFYPNLSMDYKNILASCKTKSTCGNTKDNKYNENLFVSPLDNDCEEHFKYLFDGRIKGKSDKGEYTIELLNLNSYDLKQARRTLFKMLRNYDPQYIRTEYLAEKNGKLPRFADMIKYFYDLGVFIEK